jgi:SAM-dependent methyltransferase
METLFPGVVLAAYAESLVDGRRVAVFGDATSPAADELLERGARLVHLYDPDPARAAEAAARNRSKQISVLPLDTADIAVRDGAFDVALILDLTLVDDAARLLKRIRRALAPRGVAIVASPNPDAKISLLPRAAGGGAHASISYYDLFDAVSAEFAEVRMLGQTPFVGYAVVDFSPEGEPDVSLDSGLVPGGAEEPEWFVAVASASAVEIEAFSIVQLPAARVVRASTSGDPRIAGELEAARANEARLVEHVSMLQAEVAERRAAGARAPSEASATRTRALEAELSKRDARLADVEARAAAMEARAQGAEGELEVARRKPTATEDSGLVREAFEKRAAEQRAETQRLEQRLAEQTAENRRLEQHLTERTAEKERLAKRLAEQTAEKERVEKRLAEQATDKEGFEKRLAEQGAERERLEKRASEYRSEKERLEKALAEQVTVRQDIEKRTVQHLAAKDALEKRLAEREADLQRLTAVSTGDTPDDVAVLEAALKDRGEKIRKVESDLREAERVGKELVRELAARAPARADAPWHPPAESRLLSTENARLKADLEAAGWTIQELEGRLAPAISHAAAPAPR